MTEHKKYFKKSHVHTVRTEEDRELEYEVLNRELMDYWDYLDEIDDQEEEEDIGIATLDVTSEPGDIPK